MRYNILLILLVATFTAKSQDINLLHCGEYIDAIGRDTLTVLSLKKDGTFKLLAYNQVNPSNFEKQYNEGFWVSKKDTVILNPDMERLIPEVNIVENVNTEQDSLVIKVNYYIQRIQNDKISKVDNTNFDLLTLYINSNRRKLHLIRYPDYQNYEYSLKHRNKIFINSQNVFKIKKKRIRKVGVLTYGYEYQIHPSIVPNFLQLFK